MLNKIIIVIASAFIIGVLYAKFFINGTPVDDKKFIVLESSCKIQTTKCQISHKSFKFEIESDNKIYYLKPFKINVDVAGGKVLKIVSDFKMTNMDMGINSAILKRKGNTIKWEGEALLPVCVTGRADWIVEIKIYMENRSYRLIFPLNVLKG